jgi:hypothetical protein
MARTPRPKRGEPIRAEHIVALAEAIDRCQINVGPGSGLGMQQGPNGTDLWSVGRPGKPVYNIKAKVDTSGISAGSAGGATPGTGDVTLYDALTGGSLVPGTTVLTVYNFTTTAISSGKVVTLGWLDKYGVWEVILEAC